GEAFIEYQLAAQQMRPDAAVHVAAYGDDGPGYIPTARAYLEGGYEPTVALSGPDSEAILLKSMRKLLKAEGKGGDKGADSTYGRRRRAATPIGFLVVAAHCGGPLWRLDSCSRSPGRGLPPIRRSRLVWRASRSPPPS